MTTQARTASAGDIKDATTFDFPFRTLPDGTVITFKCRRLDVLTQLMEDVVNAPMMKAAEAITKEIQEWIRAEGGNFISAFQNLDSEQRGTMLEQLRRYACATILEPKFVMGTPANADETDVRMLGADTLFALWYHVPESGAAPRLSEVAATTFRHEAGAGVAAAVSDEQSVRAAAVDVGPVADATGHP